MFGCLRVGVGFSVDFASELMNFIEFRKEVIQQFNVFPPNRRFLTFSQSVREKKRVKKKSNRRLLIEAPSCGYSADEV